MENKFLKPKNLHNQTLIIKLDEPQKTSKEGIIIPEQAQEKPTSGIVQFGPVNLVGRRVFFANYIGVDLCVGLKKMKETDIWWDEDAN